MLNVYLKHACKVKKNPPTKWTYYICLLHTSQLYYYSLTSFHSMVFEGDAISTVLAYYLRVSKALVTLHSEMICAIFNGADFSRIWPYLLEKNL